MRAASRPIVLALSLATVFAAAPLAAQTATPSPDSQTGQTQPTPPDADPTVSPVRHIGGGVLQPKLLHMVNPEFSDQAREQKLNGIVLVNLIVDTNGMPRNVHVIRGVGMGLDENAVKAVEKYRFAPATENGKPVPVELNVEVNFQIFEDPPEVLHSVKLEPSDEARQNHAKGAILLAFTIDPHGIPQNVRVLRGFGMGMDERAVEALMQYRFQPFQDEYGHPVARAAALELKFKAK